MLEQLTLYLHKLSPYSQKAELALIEANAPYKGYQIDVFNKPEWFVSKVNPVGKVPTVAYGGPNVAPDDPSPSSTKIAESNVILEFLADLYPDSGLLPKDPVSRAKVRSFVDANTKHFEDPLYGFIAGRGSYEDVLNGVEFIQGLLGEGGDFAVGDHYTIADACISPHLARLMVITEADSGKFAVGMGSKLGEELKAPKFAKFMKYADRVLERPSLKQTFDKEGVTTFFKTFYART
ncbi:glutathione S-transferase C-terminal-like protein [Suillus bovinus]|uniref:glutathione S-transferase C-terminal-like protein n=1 Tax=Suillus bovinus TaxID=48563 RepID=UPI001B8843DA|nr:glutathione S-transferase C-terminal-like protein [Suillus bovinus]KAG2152621.1 glutathione S-transferase C-terminal-like protein [Suillus bovinus]